MMSDTFTELEELIVTVGNIKVRPWNFLRVTKQLVCLNESLLKCYSELSSMQVYMQEVMLHCVEVNKTVDERFDKMWEEIYRNEEKRRSMEESNEG
jgi:hypothetical protein